MPGDPIKIDGLIPFQRALKAADANLPKQLRLVFNDAAELVVDAARPMIPRRSGNLAASARATSQQRSAEVSLGKGATRNYAGFIEFGGRVGIKRSVERRFVKEGRSLYPGMVRRKLAIEDVMAAGLNRLADEAGL